MKILVTGGAGFIGSYVVDEYVKEGHDVVVVDNLSVGKMENINKKAKFYNLDIKYFEGVLEVFKRERPDVVNHHAAHNNLPESFEDPVEDAKDNIIGSLNVILAMSKFSKKMIYASSGGLVYGEPQYVPTDEKHPINPVGPYAISKYVVEQYIKSLCEKHGIGYTILRYASVYGPRQITDRGVGVVGIFVQNLLSERRPVVYGGDQTRDFIFVKDAAEVNRIVLNKGKNKIYNVSTGSETSINDLFTKISKILNSNIEPMYRPGKKVGEVSRVLLSNEKIGKELNWKPKYGLDAGIRETIKYFESV